MKLRNPKGRVVWHIAAVAAIAVSGAIYGFYIMRQSPRVDAAIYSDNVYVSPNYKASDKLKFSGTKNGVYTSSTKVTVNNSSPGTEVLAHLIRKQNNGSVTNVQMGIYFSDKENAAFSIEKAENAACQIYDPNNDFNASNKAFVKVSFTYTTNAGQKTVYYMVHKSNACTESTALNPYNTSESQKNYKNNKTYLFATYSVPNDFKSNAVRDDATGGLYKGVVKIEYADYSTTKEGDGDNPQVFRFRGTLPTCPSGTESTCHRYIAPVSIGGSNATSNYATLRGNTSDAAKFFLAERFEFGSPCTDTKNQIRSVNVYDVDNYRDWDDNNWDGQTGKDNATGLAAGLTGVFIQQSTDGGATWSLMPYDNTTTRNNSDPSVGSYSLRKDESDPGGSFSGVDNSKNWAWGSGTMGGNGANQAVIPTAEEKVITKLYINMQPHVRYRVVIMPAATTNMLSVGLPTDSVYGLINCNTSVQPKVSSPLSNVIDGQSVSFSFSTLKDQSQFYSLASQYNYGIKVWYETKDTSPINNSTYNASEDKLICEASGNYETHPPNTLSHTIAKCSSSIKVDAYANAKGGNYPVAICAELTLQQLAGTDIKQGTNPARQCVYIGKYPSVHVTGGDVKVGDSVFASFVNQNALVKTGSFSLNGKSYGSWAEYGIFAPLNGTITSSSGGVLSGTGGTDPVSVNSTSQNRLTFANVSTYGKWASASLLSMPSAIMSTASVNSSISTNQVELGNNVGAANGEVRAWNITTPGGTTNIRGTLPANSGSLLLFYDGTVNINGDIRLGDNTVHSLGNNAQIIIVARNITIDPSVSNVDAWLIATPATSVSSDGRISTCGAIQTGSYYTGLKLGGSCDTTQLRITGPVIARELQLRRTYGANQDTAAAAAETINLRPDAYMWGNTNGGSTNIETSFVKELPPRL